MRPFIGDGKALDSEFEITEHVQKSEAKREDVRWLSLADLRDRNELGRIARAASNARALRIRIESTTRTNPTITSENFNAP